MRDHLDPLWTTVFVVLSLGWALFWIAIVMRALHTPAATEPRERKRDLFSTVGFILQGISYSLAFSIGRPYFSPLAPVSAPLDGLLALFTMALAVASSLLVAAAVHTLGRQWSITARVLSEHRLVTSGPYRLVRNPIYTGMLGMLIASGLALSEWWTLVPALIVFFVGTAIRVRAEERLLRESFGAQYDDYARRVPALIPFLA
ncbi:MAG: isoprenylcysteine carboxylmethyltransferase family protein [Chloroflexi bacterium]|nr:isoprenylcysteine carboxylmethyltransferase family protein [Chloroflexota bacterium]